MCLEQNRHLLSKLTERVIPELCAHPFLSPIAPECFSRRALHFLFFHEKIIFPMPLRDFAFSGSKKLKNLLASQGRRVKAGVAKDLGGVHPEVHDVAVTAQCGGTLLSALRILQVLQVLRINKTC